MSKWYEVKVVSVKVMAIEVEDDEDDQTAMEVASDECYDAADIDAKLVSEPFMIDSLKRHADEVFSLEDAQ